MIVVAEKAYVMVRQIASSNLTVMFGHYTSEQSLVLMYFRSLGGLHKSWSLGIHIKIKLLSSSN